MPFFVTEAKRLATRSGITKLQRASLIYLLKHCVGVQNARTIGTVLSYLNKHGFKLDGPTFQHSVIGWSRECNVYIASGRSGIYLIKTRKDAYPMMAFYEERIAAEKHRLKRLKALTQEAF